MTDKNELKELLSHVRRICIDMHGVIDSDPTYFKDLMYELTNMGIDIYVLSGPPAEEITKKLSLFDINPLSHFNKVLSIVDYLRSIGEKMWLDNKDTWWADEVSWWSAKANICEKMDIDVMIDNTNKYEPYFRHIKARFILWINTKEI